MKNRLAASAATLTCVVTTLFIANPPAQAATTPSPSAKVGIADIDLASPAGRKLLNSRVRMSAAKICLTTNVEPVKVRTARRKCYRSAIADVARVTDRVVAMRGDRSGSNTVGTI